VPDAPGLELIRGEIEQDHPGAVLDTGFDRNQPALVVDPVQIIAVLTWLRDAPGQGYGFLSSLHVADYLPAQPRFGIHYELLNRNRVERLRVKAMLADPPPAGGTAGGTTPEEALATAGGGGSPAVTGPAPEAFAFRRAFSTTSNSGSPPVSSSTPGTTTSKSIPSFCRISRRCGDPDASVTLRARGTRCRSRARPTRRNRSRGPC
jgi:hypothetical protein